MAKIFAALEDTSVSKLVNEALMRFFLEKMGRKVPLNTELGQMSDLLRLSSLGREMNDSPLHQKIDTDLDP